MVSELYSKPQDRVDLFGKLIERQARFKEAATVASRTHFAKIDLKVLIAAYMLDPRQAYLYLTKDGRKEGITGILGILLGMRNFTAEGKKSLIRELYGEASLYKNKLRQQQCGEVGNLYDWWSKQTDFNLLRHVGKR